MRVNIGNLDIEPTLDLSNAGPQNLVYNGDNTLNYIEVTIQNQVYRQTYGYTNGNITSISQWVKQ